MKTTLKDVTVVLVALLFLFSSGCATLQGNTSSTLQASGIIEATEINLAPQLSGQVIEVTVNEGDAVTKGETLLRMDDTLLQAQRREAQAGLSLAEKLVQSAQAALDSAQAQYDNTLANALEAAGAGRIADWKAAKPSGFELPAWFYNADERYQSAQAALESAKSALDLAQSNLESVENMAGSNLFVTSEKRLSDARLEFEQARQLLDKTQGASDGGRLHDAAQKTFDDANAELENAQDAYNDAVTTEGAADVLEARARWAVAKERYDLAVDTIRSMQTGERAPQVISASKALEQAKAALAQAQAQVSQAQAAIDLIDAQIEKLSLRAPLDGLLLTRSIQPGEVLQAGMTALTLANVNALKVTVYIPEDRYGEIRIGEQASLQVDSFPGESFPAAVTRIANQAEFTPRNVQTKEERQTTVYAVELSIDNSGGKLKPGMPVDVSFVPAGSGD